MKVLLDSHPTVTQNKSGGLQVRILAHLKSLQQQNIVCKLFNKWEDKIEDYDIYHLFKVTKDSYNEVLYAKQKGKKIIVSAVIPIVDERKIKTSLLIESLLKLFLPHAFIRKILDISDIITAETNEEKLFISKNYKIDLEKIVVIPNGVGERFLKDDTLDVSFKEFYNIKQPFVLQVGRIDKNKNQISVIKALKELNIPIVFIGGAYLNEMEYYEACKKELGPKMVMTDWISHESELLLSAFKEAKVLVLPSIYETFGNVLVEAGVSGANIACSETLPINEYPISKFWTKFNPLKHQSIKDAVLKEYNSPCNHEMKEEFILTFSWETVIRQYVVIYNRLLTSK
ncbi:MAG: glycosyltransferase [Myroides sp.]